MSEQPSVSAPKSEWVDHAVNVTGITPEEASAMSKNDLIDHVAGNVPSGGTTISAEQVQALIDEALARQKLAHDQELQGLLASMRGSVATFVPFHAGGVGTEIAETWSQYEQAQANAADEAERAKARSAA